MSREDLTGYKLSRQWFDFCFENPEKIRPIHTAIYMFALEHWNRLGQKRKFGFPSQMTMDAIGVKSYNTYTPAFGDLVDWGFFELIEKSKNQYSSNIIALSKINKAPEKALDKAFIKKGIGVSEFEPAPESAPDAAPNKAPEPALAVYINQEQRTMNHEPYTDGFDDFWELYDVKKGKKKAFQEWSKLTQQERDDIMFNVPIFLTHFSSKQYTPRPRKYLHNRYWEDEDYQQPLKRENKNGTAPATKGDRRIAQLREHG